MRQGRLNTQYKFINYIMYFGGCLWQSADNGSPAREEQVQMHVAVIDIGKPGKNLGWALVGPQSVEGDDLDCCIEVLARVLEVGPLALGFEAPMFVPKRDEPKRLTAARKGECIPGHPNRPYSAGAGAAVLVTALVVIPYVLSHLRTRCPVAKATMDWRRKLSRPGELLLFEAFVTNQGKTAGTRHMEDARLAAEAAQEGLLNLDKLCSAIDEPECLNLLGMVMIRTKWSGDVGLLDKPCLVVKA